MPSDYEQITKENIRRRGEEFDDIGRFLSEQLYTDRSHFIFELLQNAEDALDRRLMSEPSGDFSRCVRFRLYRNRLEFSHFGQPFDTKDVKAISDILKGTKSDDLNQIGKFGIGFKSVYAFTAIPEIHSGEEHFRIDRFIRPKWVTPSQSVKRDETLFIFPFNHDQVKPETSYQLIFERLKNLGPKVLLFLKVISEIEWSSDGDAKGLYAREVESVPAHSNVKRIKVFSGKGDGKEEQWLVFSRDVPFPDTKGVARAELAFRLSDDKRAPGVVRVNQSPLVAFFPTEKETRLGFLVQGNYRTTPSRDNIPKNDNWNIRLTEETAMLLADSLLVLKEMNLYGIGTLQALPIREQDFPNEGMFRSMYDAVRSTLSKEPLLPTDNHSFASAEHSKLARSSELRDLLGPSQLQTLFGADQPIYWLQGEISADRTPELRSYLINELGIEEVTPESFARKITITFLEQQRDGWLTKFYAFLSGQESLWRPRHGYVEAGPLRNRPFIRLWNDQHVIPFREDGIPNAYLPSKNETNFPVVKQCIVGDKSSLEFLKKLGLAEPDIVAEVLDHVLPKFREREGIETSGEIYEKDLGMIKRALAVDSESRRESLIEALQRTPFARSVNCFGKLDLKCPSEIYFKTQELECYFAGYGDAWFLDEPIMDLGWEDLGVEVFPHRKSCDLLRWDEKSLLRGRTGHTRDVSTTDYKLDGLDNFLAGLKASEGKRFREKALVLWNLLLDQVKAYPAHLRNSLFHGEYKWFYYSMHTRAFPASWVKMLRHTPWLPSRHNEDVHKPGDLTPRDLPTDFKADDVLVQELALKADETATLATRLGVSVEDIEFVRNHHDEFEEWKVHVSKPIDGQADFPIRSTRDPDRRAEKTMAAIEEAEDVEFKDVERSVRTSRTSIDPGTWLRSLYVNNHGQMVCQICKQEMPFRRRDGQHYFEAVEAFGRNHLIKELEAQFLALCPLCAAMYKEFIKKDESASLALKKALSENAGLEVALRLGELSTSVRFVETHLMDLRQILKSQ